MGSRRGAKVSRVMVAVTAALVLAGCSFDVGSVDLSGVDNVFSTIGEALSGVGSAAAGLLDGLLPSTTSYEEAKAQAEAERTPTVSSPTIIESGTLVVGLDTYGSTLPFLLVGDDGSIEGLDVSVAAAVADEMGLSVRYVPVSNAASALGDTCDVVVGVSTGDAANATVVGQFAEAATALFHKGDATTVSAADVAGATVAVQAGSVSESNLDASGLLVSKATYDNLNDCFAALEAGTVGYVACEAYPGSYLAKDYDDIALAGTLDAPAAVGIAVANDNADLQTAVQLAVSNLSSNGRMAVARSAWVGGFPSLTAASQIEGLATSEDAEATQTVDETGEATEADQASDLASAAQEADDMG